MSAPSVLALGSLALTYLVHSTLLFALVWALERARIVRALGTREALWRVVLFGAVVTTGFSVASRGEPWLGRVSVPVRASGAIAGAPTSDDAGREARAAAPEARDRAPRVADGSARERGLLGVAADGERWLLLDETTGELALVTNEGTGEPGARESAAMLQRDPAGGDRRLDESAPNRTPLDAARELPATVASTVPALEPADALDTARAPDTASTLEATWALSGTWALDRARAFLDDAPALVRSREARFALLAAALLLAAAWPSLRLRRWLGARTPVADDALRRELDELRRAAGVRRRVRLTSSPRIASPIAFGVLRPEICVPPRVLETIEPALRRAMLAHELSHVARLDPLWLALGELARRAFFFQPLARAAQRRLVHLAELACDRGAVGLTGDPIALARSLAEVAEWMQTARPRALCAMAHARSRLEERVHSLLAPGGASDRRVARWLAASLAVLGATLVLPVLALERACAAAPTVVASAPTVATPATPVRAPAPLAAIEREHATARDALAGVSAALVELGRRPLLPEEEAHARALAARVRDLERLTAELESRIAEHAPRAPTHASR